MAGNVVPPWYLAATSYLGVKEVVGKGSNPIIIQWAKRAKGWIAGFFTDDDIPWCALFVNACLDEAGIKGTNSLAARSFQEWGQPCGPMIGAVLVFQRLGGGHVGFYVGETAEWYRVRGGNQGNKVSDTWIAKGRLIGMRWPTAVPLPVDGKPVLLAYDQVAASTNEA